VKAPRTETCGARSLGVAVAVELHAETGFMHDFRRR